MIIEIRDDLSVERPGCYRAYTTESLAAQTCCTLRGYLDPRGSYRTVRAAAADAARLCPGVEIYRNGRLVRL